MKKKWRFSIDRGGTFTDIIGRVPDGPLLTFKVLSGSGVKGITPVFETLRKVIGLKKTDRLSVEHIEEIRLGTTLGTNALLERRGSKTAFLVTRGFEDILRIGHQTRPSLFKLQIKDRIQLYENCYGLEERINYKGFVISPIDIVRLKNVLGHIKSLGNKSLAIAFLNSYKNPIHEIFAKEIALDLAFDHVSVSHEVSSLIGFVDRCSTTVVDAYLTPTINKYVSALREFTGDIPLKIMQSNGGLVYANKFRGKDSILSGPAGGVVGAIETARLTGRERIICFDMGGTSTDVAHSTGTPEYRSKTEIDNITIVAPMVDIHSVAAGGGSVVSFDGIRLKVGPASAGCYPGPACYGNGGPLTITDCNLLLGFLNPDYFPKCFGKENNLGINRGIVVGRFKDLIVSEKSQDNLNMNIYQIAEGFIKIANEKMASAIKAISINKGHDIRLYSLQCYGGAAGQHCCDVADLLGIKEILVNRNASVLSAIGISFAKIKKIAEESIEEIFSENQIRVLIKKFMSLEKKITNQMRAGDSIKRQLLFKKFVNLKYSGTTEVILVDFTDWHNMRKNFLAIFKMQFGFTESAKDIIVSSIVIEAEVSTENASFSPKSIDNHRSSSLDKKSQRVFENGTWKRIPLVKIDSILESTVIRGPTIILSAHTSLMLKSGWECSRNDFGDLILQKAACMENYLAMQIYKDSFLESTLFGNRLTAIAEQMGEVLKKTAASVNIKERNDFSCAIFDTEGNLLANAPHIPVHLGSMSASVKSLLETRLVKSGETYLTNNPFNGGTHLPDITCISTVNAEQDSEISFFVASRGHHADIGGKTPGSMPATSNSIEEEGILLDNIIAVKDAKFQEEQIRELLTKSEYPARNIEQNIFDMKAQIAANKKGVEELLSKFKSYKYSEIKVLCKKLLDQGKTFVSQAIKGINSSSFQIKLDNGIKIGVSISIDKTTKKLIIDFDETDEQHWSNFNAPFSITKASVLYVLRCMINDEEIPLNEGCLLPIEIKIPSNNLLNPNYPSAVVAGNVETSQKIVDCLLGALNLQAGSQGTMNNLSFGNSNFQYYETICGGTGAGPNFDGADAIQSHMTNSRITDPEVLEHNYPVQLDEFSIRKKCGGLGKFVGGNGVMRKITFHEPMTVSILSNCRIVCPHGLSGGGFGGGGKNTLITSKKERVNLDSNCQFDVNEGDSVEIQTPCGGGFGASLTKDK